jgi:hypothetical protein
MVLNPPDDLSSNNINSQQACRILVVSWIFFVIGISWILFIVYGWCFDSGQSLLPILWSFFPMAIGGGLRNKALGREELNDTGGSFPPTGGF